MSLTVVVVVVAVVFLLVVIGAAVIIFVLKSKGGKKADGAPGVQGNAFPPPPGQQTSFGTQGASAPAPWPPPQQQPPQPWGAPAPSEPAAPEWPSFPEPAPPPPPSPGYAPSSEPDPYVTTPSADASEPLPNPDLFMTTPSTPRQTSADLAPAQLRADDGSIIHLNRLMMRVGRHPECDVVIPTPGTSRQHAEFEFRDGAWVITDLNSGNGTFVNNVRVRTQQLASGDEIRIDQTRFTFSSGG